VTRSNIGIRRAAALLSGVVGVGLLLSGCGTGQISSTANTVTAVHGANEELAVEGGSYKVRNAAVEFNQDGYPAGDDAPLEMALFNDTGEAVTVRISSTAAQGVRLVDPSAAPSPSVSESPSESPSGSPSEPSGSESPSASPSRSRSAAPSPSAAPAAPAGPATIQIPANGFVLLNTTTGPHLELVGLQSALNSGASVPMTFDFGGQQLDVAVNMAVPLTPVPRGSSVVGDENAEGETGH
jgi:hypothetical protein